MLRAPLHTVLFLFALLLASRAAAEASLFIYPTLILFEGNRTSAEVTISNRGDETGTFEIAFANMSMTPEGGLAVHTEEVAWSIQPYLRYSPRRTTLAPGESQLVRIALRRDDSAETGEYYSHLRVVTIDSRAVDAPLTDDSDPGPGVSISARSAIAIPVIWRNSLETPAASIESASFDAGANVVEVSVRRQGRLSTRGFLHVVAAGESTETVRLSDPMPLILYPSIDRRSFSIPLLDAFGAAALPAGASVIYSTDEVLGQASLIYSSLSIGGE